MKKQLVVLAMLGLTGSVMAESELVSQQRRTAQAVEQLTYDMRTREHNARTAAVLGQIGDNVSSLSSPQAQDPSINVKLEQAGPRMRVWDSQEAYDDAHRGQSIQLSSECDAHPEKCQ